MPGTNKFLAAFISVLAIAAPLFSLKFGCPFLAATGVPCPGCGMTRACLAFFRLDFAQAFLYHPLFPAVLLFPIVLAIYLALRVRNRRHQNLPFHWVDLRAASGEFFTEKSFLTAFAIIIAADIGVYIYRVILPLFHLGDPAVLRILISG
ncbi:MAG: DUF2752 domain-containing protein [Peptococcaceae bacterium]|nr:DUF2752 domain-containing protein [Peptococcaceae bacterium]